MHASKAGMQQTMALTGDSKNRNTASNCNPQATKLATSYRCFTNPCHGGVLLSGHWWVTGFETAIEESTTENAHGSSSQSTCIDFKRNYLQQAGLHGPQEA